MVTHRGIVRLACGATYVPLASCRARPPPFTPTMCSMPGDCRMKCARARPLFHALERDLGWTRVTQGGLDVQTVPGNHLTMMQEPHVRVLAARLAQLLASNLNLASLRSRDLLIG